MQLKWLILAIAFLFALNTATAGIYLGYGDSDFYFELYYGNSYHYVQTPYTYAYDSYYYFDYPYRVYSSGNYYYYDSGWYSYEPAWRFAPDNYGYYSYYPANYYYYDYSWSYYPNWGTVYAPAYYGAYYFPPRTATLTGQQYHPEQRASCDNIGISTSGVNIKAGESQKIVFYIENNSRKSDFDVANVSVSISGFDAEASGVKFGKSVAANSTGKIEFNVSADADASTGSATGTIKVSGTFKDGTYCNFSDTQENFNVNISGKSAAQNAVPDSWNSQEFQTQGSTSYIVAKETQPQGWQYVDSSGTASNGISNTLHNGIYSASTGSSAGGTTADAGSNSNIITTYYGGKQLAALDCTGLSLESESVAVDSGSSKTSYFALRNYASEDFTIDAIDAVEHNQDFAVEASRDSGIIFSGQTSSVKVKALASETAEDSTGSAYVQVKGHFGSGLSCTVLSGNFYVRVNGSADSAAENFSLNVPAEMKMDSASGLFELSFENNSDEYVEVSLSADNAIATPKSFSVKPKSSGSRIIAVNGFEESKATVFYSIESSGVQQQKYTKLVKPALFADSGESAINGVLVKKFTAKTDGAGTQKISVELENNSGKDVMVSLGLRGLPRSFEAETENVALKAGETRSVELSFNADEGGDFKALLTVNANGLEQLFPVEISVPEAANENAAGNETANNVGVQGLGGMIATGFSVLGENPFLFGLVVLAGMAVIVALMLVLMPSNGAAGTRRKRRGKAK
ncbi:MAG TPA: hypothetical protein VFF09_01090 [archaeon]|nr:hypothetical protein [archaeon]